MLPLVIKMNLYDKTLIHSYLTEVTKNKLQFITLEKQLTSTNSVLLQQAQSGQFGALIAEEQTQGRGCQGKNWYSPAGQGLYLSLIWSFKKKVLSGLSLAIGIGLCEAFQAKHIGLRLKWPNDLFYQAKKLGGILVETHFDQYQSIQGIIGIGINSYLNSQGSLAIDQPWIDLNTICKTPFDPNELVGLVLNSLVKTLLSFEEEGFAPFALLWAKYDALKNKLVSVKKHQGKVLGIDQQGGLVIKTNQGTQVCYSGKVTILE